MNILTAENELRILNVGRIDEGFYLVGENFEIRVSRNPISLDLNLIQTHGARVVIYKGQREDIGDGASTDRVGVVLGVKTADCFPIFLISKFAVGYFMRVGGGA